jgi:hypothetical protein
VATALLDFMVAARAGGHAVHNIGDDNHLLGGILCSPTAISWVEDRWLGAFGQNRKAVCNPAVEG